MIRPLISYYGDDFTGSTDVMEALAGNGIETVLFLRVPDETVLDRFSGCRAIGLAGTSRSETPEWMDTHLLSAFRWLKSLNAEFAHYKVCSTFDSAPGIGNIGRAIEIGRDVFGNGRVPMIVGAPQIRRYTSFGQLFAAYQGRNYRIDRHPVMCRHPVTPMDEADILLHLSRQTQLRGTLVDRVALTACDSDTAVDAIWATPTEIVLFDVDGSETQRAAGHQLWGKRDQRGQFVCGSSGVEYALIEPLRAEGLVGAGPGFADAGPVDRIAVVSGSVSPTTERQLRHAMQNGFAGIAVDPLLLSGDHADAEMARVTGAALAALAQGQSPIVYTALGPSTDRGGSLGTADGARHRLSRNLGRILARLVREAGLARAVIAGGDTSSHALGELGVSALTLKMPLPQTPGSPLCLAHGDNESKALEIALKGGQVGHDDYFSMIRAGRA